MLRGFIRKFIAVAALVALLSPVASNLAGLVYASQLPMCCNTNYCPLHHSNRSNSQKGSPCPGKDMPGQSSSIRACDSSPNPIVGTEAYVLVTPVSLRAPITTEVAYGFIAHFVPSLAAIPLTPPPRTVQI
jgi:hypothetical protein